MSPPATSESGPPESAAMRTERWSDYGRPLIIGWSVLFLWAVVDGKCAWASRWSIGWEFGLMSGALAALFLGLPHVLLQWGLLFVLKRFTRLPLRARTWLANLPVLVAATWMLGGRYVAWQPQRIFAEFVQQPAPASLRILDVSVRRFEFSEPKLWAIVFMVAPADWVAVTNGYVAVPVTNDKAQAFEPELRRQEDELRAELAHFLRREIAQCGIELPMLAPFQVLRRTHGDIAARVNSKELRSDWGDFLFYREDDVGHAFFFRGPIGDEIEELAGM